MKKNLQIIIVLLGMFFVTKLQAQVKIGSNPNTISTNVNLEVEASNGLKTVITKDSGSVGIGTNTPNINALLEMNATNKGLLLPRVALKATSNASPLTAHVVGMVVYNTATIADVSPGFYTNDGTKWNKMIVSTGFVPEVVASASLSASYFYDDGAPLTKCKLGVVNSSDGNYSATNFEYSVSAAGTYNLSLTLGYVLNNNNGNNVHTMYAVHANSAGTIIKIVDIAQINGFSYTGSQSSNIYMAGSAVFRPSVGDKLYFMTRPCNGCAGRYTVVSLEGTFQKISN